MRVVWCIIGTKIPKSSVIHKCIESLFIHGSMSVFFGYHGRLSSLVTGVCVPSGFPSLFLVGFDETACKLKKIHVREEITGGIWVSLIVVSALPRVSAAPLPFVCASISFVMVPEKRVLGGLG